MTEEQFLKLSDGNWHLASKYDLAEIQMFLEEQPTASSLFYETINENFYAVKIDL